MLIGLTIFNAVLGLRQEAKAEASLAALQKMLKDIARVRRDGVAVEIDAAELVPGDIVLFEAGNRVPGRRSAARRRHARDRGGRAHRRERPGAEGHRPDRRATTSGSATGICLAFMNTSVTRGRGEMIVTGTGMDTEIGSIATLLNQTEADKTPLQKQLDRLTQVIVGIAGIAFVAMVLARHPRRPAVRRRCSSPAWRWPSRPSRPACRPWSPRSTRWARGCWPSTTRS